ncbi:hypothetical protein [Mangrovivirga cuniculi]|uniref:Uncharacterized protein n=1 Tax=Mangrovivirga cuniculi TaxID=2715131 RepID=A0A4D7K8K6_9BACT|nr:hypothetical protein [Mangrovivirga cuniculi]QCK15608.1 hypothetical protein DCC35_13065 [Mangrovivirga cuniculi]
MSLADPLQKFQDWFTQQWAILWGRKIDPDSVPWLMGPFGKTDLAGEDFIKQLAEDEELTIQRNTTSQGLIPSIDKLNLPDKELKRLSPEVIDFYENTANYFLNFSVKWNPPFKFFGHLVNILFSSRINQLNVPIGNLKASEQINSEIITLYNHKSGLVKYTFWYRTFKSTGQVLYSGIYTTCILPTGEACVKAIFPLPKGNATVILSPKVGSNGELQLKSSGRNFGDPGFYFLLNDSKGKFWAQYVSSFQDELIVFARNNKIFAEQKLTLWGMRVLKFNYEINHKSKQGHSLSNPSISGKNK